MNADHWADPDEYEAMVKEMRKMQDDLDAADRDRDTALDLLAEGCAALSFQRAIADEGSPMALLLARIDAFLKATDREPRCTCPCCEKARAAGRHP